MSSLDCGHQRPHSKNEFSGSGGTRPGRNLQQKASDAVVPCHMDASSVIGSAPGPVTLAAALVLLCADNRDTGFPPRQESRLFQQGAAAQDIANVQSQA